MPVRLAVVVHRKDFPLERLAEVFWKKAEDRMDSVSEASRIFLKNLRRFACFHRCTSSYLLHSKDVRISLKFTLCLIFFILMHFLFFFRNQQKRHAMMKINML